MAKVTEPLIEVRGRTWRPPQPPPPPPRSPWGLIAFLVCVLALAGAGAYALYRAGRPSAVPALAAQADPVGETATTPGTGAVAAVAAALPTKPPMAAVVSLTPSEAITPAALTETIRQGAIRVSVTAPDYAAAFLANTGKRLQLDTNTWESVPAFPRMVVPVLAGPRRIRVEAVGFDCASLQGTNEVDVLVESGVTNEAAFTLTPRPATLTVTCNVTNAIVQTGEQKTEVGNPVTIPSLKPLALAVSAPGHRAQVLKLDALPPGATERREVRLQRELKVGDTMSVDLGGGTKLELVWCPPGTTKLGSSQAERDWAEGSEGQGQAGWCADDGPPQQVPITNGFWLGRTEMTVEQWRRFAEAVGYRTDAEKEGQAFAHDAAGDGAWKFMNGKDWRTPGFSQTNAHPVTCVSWNDAKAFCAWLTKKEQAAGRLPDGFAYRLPGEAEWAYACRGGREGTKFWWGERLADGEGRMNGAGTDPLPDGSPWSARYGWKDGYAYTSPADCYGEPGRSGFGLADMLGNVWEWCEDGYDEKAPHDTIWTGDTSRLVLRGGAFNIQPCFLRCAGRAWGLPTGANASFGFRLCMGAVSP